MEVDEGKEDKGEVNIDDYAGCREDNDDGEGVQLLEGEEAATRKVGGCDRVVVLHHLLFYMDTAMDSKGIELLGGDEAATGGVGSGKVVVHCLLLLYMDAAMACPNLNYFEEWPNEWEPKEGKRTQEFIIGSRHTTTSTRLKLESGFVYKTHTHL